jgi:hypothetical protein
VILGVCYRRDLVRLDPPLAPSCWVLGNDIKAAPDGTSTSTPYLESRSSGVVTGLSKVRSYFNQALILLFLFFGTGIDSV